MDARMTPKEIKEDELYFERALSLFVYHALFWGNPFR
jgi:hypothetical protein